MMLPSDIALIEDPHYRKWVEVYAKDEPRFFADFAAAFARLIALGCPADCDPTKLARKAALTPAQEAGLLFRENAMHGSVLMLKKYRGAADVHELEATSQRSALHKAAFWGHVDATRYLLDECKARVNGQDNNGDTAAHDAARFGHAPILAMLIKAGADLSIRNKQGQTVKDVAIKYEYPDLLNTVAKL